MWRTGNSTEPCLWPGGHVVAAAIIASMTITCGAAPLVDWAHGRRACTQIQRWVDQRTVDEDVEPIEVEGLAAAKVTLRGRGRTIASGEMSSPSTTEVNLIEVVQAATRRALGAAAAKDDGGLLVADLQLAKAPEPIQLSQRASADRIYDQFVPGYHGIIISDPDGNQSAWSWPGNSLAANYTLGQQLTHLLRNLGHQPDRTLKMLGRSGGPSLERFEVIHLARTGHGQPLLRLIRGNTPIENDQITEAKLGDMSKRLAAHLIARQRQDGAFKSILLPTVGEYKDSPPTSNETALVAYALARHAAVVDPKSIELDAVKLTVRRAMQSIVDRTTDELTMALTVLTINASRDLADLKPHRKKAVEMLLASQRTARLDETNQAIITAALASQYVHTRDPALADAAQTVIDRIWRKVSSQQILGALSWLLRAQEQINPVTDQTQHHQSRASRLVERLWRRQIDEPPEFGPPDVVGGFDLRKQRFRGAPAPDWRSAQCLTAVALAVKLRYLTTEAQVDPAVIQCSQTARFLAQLLFNESSCYYVPDPDLVLGGVRASLTNNTVGITPTAVTLLAVAELRQTLSELARFGGPR